MIFSSIIYFEEVKFVIVEKFSFYDVHSIFFYTYLFMVLKIIVKMLSNDIIEKLESKKITIPSLAIDCNMRYHWIDDFIKLSFMQSPHNSKKTNIFIFCMIVY